MHAKSLQSRTALCDPTDCSLPGFSVHGVFQARILEWVAISFSGDLPNPGVEPGSPALQAAALSSEPPGKPHKNTLYFGLLSSLNVDLQKAWLLTPSSLAASSFLCHRV